MQQLKIHTRSIFFFLVIWLGTTIMLLWGITKLTTDIPVVLALLLSVIIVIGARVLSKKMSDGILSVSISNMDMSFKWDKKPTLTAFNRSTLHLKDISDYQFVRNTHFSVIKIILKDGTVIKIEGKTTDDDNNNDAKKMVKRLKNIKQQNTTNSK